MQLNWFEYLMELVAPSFCLACRRLGPPLCADCYHGLEFYYRTISCTDNEAAYAPDISNTPNVQIVCRFCQPLSKLLKTYKYQSAQNLAPFLARLLFQHATVATTYDYLTYIPLHPLKLRQRGFNQCQVIANQLGALWQLPVAPLLERTIYLSPQAQVKDQLQRQTRVKGIFKTDTHAKKLIEGKRILLFDDVWTTGATWSEAQRVLLAAGAAKVDGLILASKKQ